MTLLFMPATLFAVILLTSVFCSIATGLLFSISSVSTIAREPSLQTPQTPIGGFYPEWLTLSLEDSTQTLFIQPPVVRQPIRVHLRWESNKMDKAPVARSSMSDMPPPPLPCLPESSTNSQPTTRSMKRFSINLPLQISDAASFSAAATMASPATVSPSISPSPTKPPTVDPSMFLTALAAQERRVLELKEELEKAESDLSKLKKQWAVHEATKKRNEIRHMEPLRQLKSSQRDLVFLPQHQKPEIKKMNREEERKRAMYIQTKQPRRKVFEGGRHTRALSLLSPTSLASRGEIAATLEKRIDSTIGNKSSPVPHTAVPRVSTALTQRNLSQPKGSKDDLVSTGKQLVGDIREGLWTFIEDLRQATVGDEALTAARSRQIESAIAGSQGRKSVKSQNPNTPVKIAAVPRKKSPTATQLGNENESGPLSSESSSRRSSTLKPLPEPSRAEVGPTGTEEPSKAGLDDGTDDEGWSNWDSPMPKDMSSNFSATASSTPRSSLSSDIAKDKRRSVNLDQIPWPALQKPSPSSLTRTASNLMKEWESGLNLPAYGQASNGLGARYDGSDL